MSDNIFGIDFDGSIKDYDYTRNAINDIDRLISSEEFLDNDAEMILTFLKRQPYISFKDYLKRYIYRHADIREPFASITDDIYRQIIDYSFQENYAPHSFEPTTRRWPVIIKGWLTQNSVRRDNVFLLGFGLKMNVIDVEAFLIKALREKSFDFRNPNETVYWYCFQNGLSYQRALSLLEKADQLGAAPAQFPVCRSITNAAAVLTDDEKVVAYLHMLKTEKTFSSIADTTSDEFAALVERTKRCIAKLYTEDVENTAHKVFTTADIRTADIENMIYSAVPRTKDGNLQKMSSSELGSHFGNYRLTRQRLDRILDPKKPEAVAERFDFLTLLFYVYTIEHENTLPEVRFHAFIDEANQLLEKCGMYKVYPITPYESFILMCLFADFPLVTSSDIWEQSFDN